MESTASAARRSTLARLQCCFRGSCSEYFRRLEVAAYVGANLFMVLVALFENIPLGCEGHNAFAIAKVGGYLMTLNFGLVAFPVLRNLREVFLHNRKSLKLALFSAPQLTHMTIGVMIVVGMCIHVAGHAWHYGFMEAAKQEQGPCSQMVYELYRGPTGILLLLLLLPMSITSLPCIRRAESGIMKRLGGFSLFQRMHKHHLVFVVLFFHGVRTTQVVVLAVGALYFLNWILQPAPREMRVVEFELFPPAPTQQAPSQRNAAEGRPRGGQLLCRCMGALVGTPPARDNNTPARGSDYNSVVPPAEVGNPNSPRALAGRVAEAKATTAPEAPPSWRVLIIKLAKGHFTLGPFTFKAGQYVWIRIGDGEVHPFTIASGEEDDHVMLAIRLDGRDWCENVLCKHITEAGSEASLQVIGPYFAPAVQVWTYKVALLVAGGIGVTPMMSILKSLASRLARNTEDLPTKVYVVVSVSTRGQADFFLDDFRNIARGAAWDRVHIRIHTTRSEHTTDVEEQASNFCIESGRPNLHTLFSQVDRWHQGPGPIGVFCCGPQSITDDCRQNCDERNRESGAAAGGGEKKFHFWPEHF